MALESKTCSFSDVIPTSIFWTIIHRIAKNGHPTFASGSDRPGADACAEPKRIEFTELIHIGFVAQDLAVAVRFNAASVPERTAAAWHG